MPMTIIISNSEYPRFFLDVITLFRGGGGAGWTRSRSDGAREPTRVRINPAHPLQRTVQGEARSFIASCFILGRGWSGVKARQSNAGALAFCHLQWLPTVPIDGRTLRRVPSVFAMTLVTCRGN